MKDTYTENYTTLLTEIEQDARNFLKKVPLGEISKGAWKTEWERKRHRQECSFP